MSEDWATYFREYRERIDAAKAVDGIEEQPIRVLSVDDAPSEEGLGRSVASLLAKVREAGWELRIRRSVVLRPTTYYASDSETYSKGDLKKEVHETVHWFIAAWFKPARLAFRTEWTEAASTSTKLLPLPAKPTGIRKAKGYELKLAMHGPKRQIIVPSLLFKFEWAIAHDPFGMPTELWANYEPSGLTLKPLTNLDKERRHADALRQASTYNDGADYLERKPLFTKTKEFDEWLDEALDIAAKVTDAAQRKEIAA